MADHLKEEESVTEQVQPKAEQVYNSYGAPVKMEYVRAWEQFKAAQAAEAKEKGRL